MCQATSNLRIAGWSDLRIAETIHVNALFACFNRVASAFGLPSREQLPVLVKEAGHK
jgi:alkylhydroperoxidase family enzyme